MKNIFRKQDKYKANDFFVFYVKYLESLNANSIYDLLRREYNLESSSASCVLIKDKALDEIKRWWQYKSKPMDAKDFINWIGKEIILL